MSGWGGSLQQLRVLQRRHNNCLCVTRTACVFVRASDSKLSRELYVTAQTQHLDRLGQVEQASNTDSEL